MLNLGGRELGNAFKARHGMPQIGDRCVTVLEIEALQELLRIVCAHPIHGGANRIGRTAVARQSVCRFFGRHRRYRDHPFVWRQDAIITTQSHYSGTMRIRIKRIHPAAVVPTYAHGPSEDAGMDLCAVEDAVLEPGVSRLVATGLTIEIPPGYEAQVRPRSGLALRHSIAMPNAPGTIDPGYRGELREILLNLGREPYTIRAGDRIAQMIVAKYEAVDWVEEDLTESHRGAGGFGSSGR